MSTPKPDINITRAVEDVKRWIDAKKFDMVDYSSWRIQTWPDPNDDAYPEIKKFAAQWATAFDYVDAVFEDNGFPEEMIQEFEAVNKAIAEGVNADAEFWDRIRAAVIPLYEQSKAGESTSRRQQSVANFSDWRDRRWKFIKFFYDPIGLDVQRTEGYAIKNVKTGEVRKRVLFEDGVTKTTYPAGFVIAIDEVYEK